MPEALREFAAGDWQEWMLPGPDPALEPYHDRDSTAFYAGIADRPELVARWRAKDAYARWTEVRRAWLAEHVSEQEAMSFWIDAISERHRSQNERRPPATPRRGW
jgi:hypothetical protein